MDRGIKVLIVDDDKDYNVYLTKFLTDEGYVVKGITKPMETISVLDQEKFHIIILDLKMPQISGTELLKEIKAKYHNICVIVLTGYPSFKSAVETMKLDAFDYLKKPFDLNDLRRALCNAQRTYGLIGSSKDKLKSAVGKKLKFLRKSKKITQKQLAERTGLSPSLLSQIENGQIAASLTTLDKLSSSLNAKMSYFLEDESDQSRAKESKIL
ncbi:MAG: response regulator [Candidatus Loosdrechtia sp.]|uniref:response regulator n=1 Tax=Candidatus Loosdrechtia sp. TaxID=3101272 RepID=UPI003A75F650|nr:MAG: response regulator [Candidatus Jettenia sp. AMX2]